MAKISNKRSIEISHLNLVYRRQFCLFYIRLIRVKRQSKKKLKVVDFVV